MIRSRTEPKRARRGPKAFAATMPPTVFRSGSGGSSARRWPCDAERFLQPCQRHARLDDDDLVGRRVLDDARQPARAHDGVEPRGRRAEIQVGAAADEGERLAGRARDSRTTSPASSTVEGS